MAIKDPFWTKILGFIARGLIFIEKSEFVKHSSVDTVRVKADRLMMMVLQSRNVMATVTVTVSSVIFTKCHLMDLKKHKQQLVNQRNVGRQGKTRSWQGV